MTSDDTHMFQCNQGLTINDDCTKNFQTFGIFSENVSGVQIKQTKENSTEKDQREKKNGFLLISQ